MSYQNSRLQPSLTVIIFCLSDEHMRCDNNIASNLCTNWSVSFAYWICFCSCCLLFKLVLFFNFGCSWKTVCHKDRVISFFLFDSIIPSKGSFIYTFLRSNITICENIISHNSQTHTHVANHEPFMLILSVRNPKQSKCLSKKHWVPLFFYIQSKEVLTHEKVLNQTAFHVQLPANICGFILMVSTVFKVKLTQNKI